MGESLAPRRASRSRVFVDPAAAHFEQFRDVVNGQQFVEGLARCCWLTVGWVVYAFVHVYLRDGPLSRYRTSLQTRWAGRRRDGSVRHDQLALRRDRGSLFVVRVGLQHQVADTLL